MDFGALPPEINSARMYAGAGAGPLLAAAAVWEGLAADLASAATSYSSVIAGLAGGPWLGPASMSMAAAAAPYVAWMHTTAAQAEQTAVQASAAAAAYEAAFAMTVPPAVIAANRALLMALIATNILGQNTPAIAATEAQYGQMWAQDAAAMYMYAGSSAAASALTPFTPPQPTTNPAGLAGQGAAVAQATGTSASTDTQAVLSQLTSTLPTALQQLASPLSSTSSTSSLSTLSSSLTPPEYRPVDDQFGRMDIECAAIQRESSEEPAAGRCRGQHCGVGIGSDRRARFGHAGIGGLTSLRPSGRVRGHGPGDPNRGVVGAADLGDCPHDQLRDGAAQHQCGRHPGGHGRPAGKPARRATGGYGHVQPKHCRQRGPALHAPTHGGATLASRRITEKEERIHQIHIGGDRSSAQPSQQTDRGKENTEMTTRFMTDPHQMRAMAGRFDVHAQTVEDEARTMWASSQNIAGAGWSGAAQTTSYDTMGQMNTAFRNIVTMLHGVRDGLIHDANNYEAQEQASQQILSS